MNEAYLSQNNLSYSILSRGTAWFDAGSIESLFAASSYVKAIEEREGVMVGCLEEVAWRNGWISINDLEISANELKGNIYSDYLYSLLDGSQN